MLTSTSVRAGKPLMTKKNVYGNSLKKKEILEWTYKQLSPSLHIIDRFRKAKKTTTTRRGEDNEKVNDLLKEERMASLRLVVCCNEN